MAARKRKPSLFPSILPDVLNPVHQLKVIGRFVRRSVHQPGTSPGTLVHAGPKRVEQVRVTVVAYGKDTIAEREVVDLKGVFPLLAPPMVTWVDVAGLHEVELIRGLGERLGVHPLVLEDIVCTDQRAKVEEHEGYLYVVVPTLSVDPESGTVSDDQLSILLGTGWLITFQVRQGANFTAVRERLKNPSARLRNGSADYLCYALLDTVVDHYFKVLETIGDAAEQAEIEVIERPRRATMHRLHALRREMLVVRRAVWPVRDVMNGLVRTESPLMGESTRIYLRDIYDHAVRIIDTAEVLRDLLGGAMDLYLSGVSNRTNETIKALTVMASIFIPLTFIVGIYGMNFTHMPELDVPWAYPTLMISMAVLALGMLLFFWVRGWL